MGISKVKTKYAFILNPDAYLDKYTLQELFNVKTILNEDFSILSPKIYNNEIFWGQDRLIFLEEALKN